MTADVPTKLKHLSAQVAIAPQSFMAFSHGSALWGQQSVMSSIVDVSAGAGDLELVPAPPTVGRIASDRATRSVRTVRPMFMDQAK
jgi:hypothetical protein